MSDQNPTTSINRAQLADWESFCASHPDIAYLNAVFTDQCGTVRGKRIPLSDASKVFTSGLQLPMSVYFLDVTGVNEDICGRGFSDGDPDGNAFPIAGTITLVPWASDQAQVLMTMETPEGEVCEFEPRNVLSRVVSKLADKGLTAVTAVELEFYLLDPVSDERGRPRPPLNPATGERETSNQVYGLSELDGYTELLRDIGGFAEAMQVPASAAVAEFAPGQYEINLTHGPDPLRAGDHGVLLRYLISAAAKAHGHRASFMAKPFLDQTGNGCHIHASVLDGEGRNIFDDGGEAGTDALRHAIGGLQDLLPVSMAILAPNLNAYRRFAPNLFVPVNDAWGYNNRSVAFRIPTGSTSARRIEHRVAGADINPYLVLAVILAGIHYGLDNKREPGQPSSKNACDEVDPNLPLSLPDALALFAASSVMREYLGDEFVEIYAETKSLEHKRFQNAISEREYDWYL
jgi:glutamine synthetase